MNQRILRSSVVALIPLLFGSISILLLTLSVSGQASLAPVFSLSAGPSSATVYQGQSATYTVGINATAGFTLPVALSVAAGPELASALSPAAIHPGETATLLLTSTLSTRPKLYTATLTGTTTLISGTTPITLSAATPVTITVLPADFGLQVAPATVSRFRGTRAVFTVALTATTPGFAWPVALDVTGVPAGATFILSPSAITAGAQATLQITTTGATPLGAHTLTVHGTLGEFVRAAGTTLRVRAGVYLPFLALRWPVFPDQPVLLPITNPDADGDYVVSWAEPREPLAEAYVLQEATDPAFTTGVREVCTTAEQSCAISGQSPGTYYYRVRGRNASGFGPWSAAEAVTVLPPGVEPATATPSPTPTGTPLPTRVSYPTPTPTAAPTQPPGPYVVITHIFYNGVKGPAEPDEYVEIRNIGAQAAQLQGWTLRDEDLQTFTFPNYLMAPGQTCRGYTNEDHPEWCGFNFESLSAIWNNSGDCAQLIDASGALVDEMCY